MFYSYIQTDDVILYIHYIQKLMSFFSKFRTIIVILRLFYWYAFKGVVKSYWHHKTAIKCANYWAEQCKKYLRITYVQQPSSEILAQGKAMIFSNHRSQADFFIHNTLTEYNANFLSRMLVGVVFFVFGLFTSDHLWLFNRSNNIDHQKFNLWLDKKYSKSAKNLILAYPEGHRMGNAVKVQKQKLKSGMIRYAYRRKFPTQILMSFGNELIFNEKKLSTNWDQTVFYSYSKVFNPEQFQTEDLFVNKVKEEFCTFFNSIYAKYVDTIEKKA